MKPHSVLLSRGKNKFHYLEGEGKKNRIVDEKICRTNGFLSGEQVVFLGHDEDIGEQQAVVVSSIHSVHRPFPGPRAGGEVSLESVN